MIGNIIKRWRHEEGLTGKEVAERVGVTQTYINKVETGNKKLSKKVFDNLILEMKGELKKELEDEFYLSGIPNQVLSRIEHMSEIPYFPSVNASAGYGCLNDDECLDHIDVPVKYSKKGNIAINVSGDSMSPKLETGDIIVVDTNQREFYDNKIVVINFNGELYVKKIFADQEGIKLISVNPYYPIIKVDDDDEFKVLGKVIFSFREYN